MNRHPLYRAIVAAGLVAASAAIGAQDANAPRDEDIELESVVVTGSRIPRATIEGPAPVTVVTAEDIRAKGLATVYDVVRSLTQSTGSVQTQQFQGFTPGAQQVDLRGLGPSYTLVLVNGRRMADFPLAYNGQSNFADIANIPVSMIERIEVLTGSASAIYGSDAISGVINFILKKKADGATLNYRVGDTHDGGGFSQRLQLSGGGSLGALDALLGIEFYRQDPIFQYQRAFQDSLEDNPALSGPAVPSRVFLRWNPATLQYIDPGQATCDALAHLDRGSITYSFRPNRGYFCGSTEALYGTVQNERENAVGYAALTYHFSDETRAYLDFQAAHTRAKYGGGPNFWSYTGSPDNAFINADTGTYESWQRIFTPEEVGGLEAIFDYNRDTTRSLSTGIEGHFGDWHYDAGYSHARFRMVQAHRAIVAADADRFFLGESLGIDDDTGYTIFAPDVSRLYRPLTRSEYESISRFTPIDAHTRAESFNVSVNNGALFALPAGDVGMAAVAEYGTQSYAMNIDPDVLANRYFGWTGTGGNGTRSRYALGTEFRVPVLASLSLTPAVRYDSYSFAGHTTAKATQALGLEWRPHDTLLVRGSAATSFRAPDLHYVYAGPSGAYYTLTDYYLCRSRQPDVPYSDCDFDRVSVRGTRRGNRELDSESGKSFTYGFVWSPAPEFDVSLDYYDIRLENVITDRDLDEILRSEADCRLGVTESGAPVSAASPTCVQVLALVSRNPDTAPVAPGQINGADTNPINAAALRNSGIDASLNYRLDTARFGHWAFRLNYTGVLDYTYQQFPGDDAIDVRDDRGYNNLRSKVSGSVAWRYGPVTTTLFGQRYGSLPKSDQSGRYGPSMTYNLSLDWAINERTRLGFAVANLRNSPPHRDATNSIYPYYDQFQFDPIGRQYFIEFAYRFGGSAGR